MSRLPAQPGELIDRDRIVRFIYEGRPANGYAGDTVASALFSTGRRVFSRSFKYHRPRGLLCCSGHCPNCMMTVDGVPNVRTCVEPLREGARVEAQNVLGSLERDLMAVTDKLGGPFTPPGFYYKTFIRPKRLWPLYEKFLRNAAGLGRVPEHADPDLHGSFEVEHRHADVLVVGGGRTGLEAAIAAAREGRHATVVDEGPEAGGGLLLERGGTTAARALVEAARAAGVEVLAPARAIGIYQGNLVPVEHGRLLLRFRAAEVVVAAGIMEQPLVFPGNDLVGVMLPGAVRRLVNLYALRPGERAVVVTVDGQGLDAASDLRAAGVHVEGVFDLRERPVSSVSARGRRGRLRSVTVDGARIDCDLLVMSGSPQPAYPLLAHAGATVDYDASRGVFVPTAMPQGVRAVGAASGEVGSPAVPPASLGEAGGKCFVCFCEDQTAKDLKYAIDEGFDSIELSKRYTTVTMGPCQGKLCHLGSIRVHAKEQRTDEATIGTTTARPPWSPVPLGLLAGNHHEPAKRTSMHHRHEDMGARIFWTGAWRRPHSYTDDVQAEAQRVHESLGLIDVSTLGKLLVKGPDAGAFLDRLYPNRFSDLKVGRIRYGILTSDAGRIFDDGTVARLADDEFYVTTTSTGADGVFQWFEWWNAVWHMEVELANLTGAVAAVNVAGPDARRLMEKACDVDVGNEAFTYLDAKHAHVAGVPALVLRIGFVGELGYEIHFPSPHGEHVWDTLLELGKEWSAGAFGLEPQRILRLEKMHILVGQDTDGESNPLEAAMAWIAKLDKDDFVGKWAIEHVAERGLRSMLVGFEMLDGRMPVEGAQVVVDGKSAGRVTSVRWSEQLQKVIGMAVVPIEFAEDGRAFDIRIDGRLEQGLVTTKPFFDPEGARLRS